MSIILPIQKDTTFQPNTPITIDTFIQLFIPSAHYLRLLAHPSLNDFEIHPHTPTTSISNSTIKLILINHSNHQITINSNHPLIIAQISSSSKPTLSHHPTSLTLTQQPFSPLHIILQQTLPNQLIVPELNVTITFPTDTSLKSDIIAEIISFNKLHSSQQKQCMHIALPNTALSPEKTAQIITRQLVDTRAHINSTNITLQPNLYNKEIISDLKEKIYRQMCENLPS